MLKFSIILEQDGNIESHGSITSIAKKYDQFKYSTLIRKKFPFNYKGVNFLKVAYNQKSGNIKPE